MLHQKWVFGLAVAISAVACAHLPGGFDMSGLLASSGTSNQSSSSSSTVEEEVRVNGKRVDLDDEEDDGRRGKKKKAKHRRDRDEEEEDEEEAPKKKPAAGDDIGATCRKNDECSAKACFVGAGDLGYCTKMCNSWSDCPTHWECKRAGNAPQKICMQDD